MGERILICGDRNWASMVTIQRKISEWLEQKTIDCIIEGGAHGADRMARWVGKNAGIKVVTFPAQWQRYGAAAGPIRNKQMLTEGKPTAVLAFHNDIASSRGTKNMVEQARKAGVYVEVIREED